MIGTSSTAVVLGGSLLLAACGFILYDVGFFMNTTAVTAALYIGTSIVLGFRLKSRGLLSAFAISALFVIVSGLSFTLVHQFVALCVSLLIMLAMVRYSLIKDHDSGWFGAISCVVLSLFFLMIVQIVFALGYLFLG